MFRSVVLAAALFAALPARAELAFSAPVACADADSSPALKDSLCVTTHVPLRHASPGDGSLKLFVRWFPAETVERRGEVWLLAGGLGESGASLYPVVATFRRAFPGYDLMIPDHRGVGRSERICPVQEAADSADGVALAGDEWGGCIGAMYADAARTQAFSVTEAAQDLALLMSRYRGSGPTYLYGVSYGTQLALRALQVAPMPLDGLILDGLVPLETTEQWDLSRRTALVDVVGRAVLGEQKVAVYQRVLAAAPTAPWKDEVPGGDLRRLLGSLLNFPALRSRIPDVVDGLGVDDTSALPATVAELKTAMAGMGQGGNNQPSLPLVMLISASENNARPGLTRELVEQEAAGALFVSAIPGFLVGAPVPAYAKDAWFGKSPGVLPRTLVVHGTLDPNTAYAGAVEHAAVLGKAGEVSFSTVEGGAHLLSYFAPGCFVEAVGVFVEGGEVGGGCVER